METEKLNVSSFKYLDYLGKREQLDIANLLDKPFGEIEDFILQLQSFDIKDATKDLNESASMLITSAKFDEAGNIITLLDDDGKLTYDAVAVSDLKAIWDVLPQDVKDAYGALNSLAVSQQSGFLAGQQTTLDTTLAGNVSKELQDISDTLSNV